MKIKMGRLLILVFLVFGVILSSVQAAVPLQTKIDYMEKLEREAVVLENQGYYDESVEKSKEVQKLSGEIDSLIAVLKKWFLLQRNIAVAKQIGADRTASEEFNEAINFYKSAEQAFVDDDLEKAENDIDEGLYYIDIAIGKAREFYDQQNQNNEDRINSTHDMEVVKDNDSQEYVVKLIPQKRDCLWRIAEYDFIYGDPWAWRRIYNANRDTIKDPDLIYPGQRLIIPPKPYEPEL